MTDIFVRVTEMSLTASIVICVVILLRILLKKAPKIFSYLLWTAVLFRLLCPVSIEMPSAFIPDLQIPYTEYADEDSFIQDTINVKLDFGDSQGIWYQRVKPNLPFGI